jgi:ribosome-binding factor A
LLTHNIAQIYFNRQQPLPAWDLVQHIQKKYGPPDKQDAVLYYTFIGDVLKVHSLLKQFQLAEPYCRQLIDAERENQLVNYELSDVYVSILDYFLASGQYIRMLPYLKKDEVVIKSYANPRNKVRLQQLWFSYDTSQHNYRSAVDHLLQYHNLYSTINNQARDRSLKELQVQFDTKKKEDQIILLNKEAQLEKANLKQATLVKNMTIAGIIAVLIIAGLLYRQSRLRKKNNTVIINKNEQLQHFLTEKEWLLKEIHHPR